MDYNIELANILAGLRDNEQEALTITIEEHDLEFDQLGIDIEVYDAYKRD